MEQYIRVILGVPVTDQPWDVSSELPQYLRERYRFFGMDILQTECQLMGDAGEEERSPAVISRHLDQVRSTGSD